MPAYHYSKSGGSSSLDVATGTRRPTPPGTGEVTQCPLSSAITVTGVCAVLEMRVSDEMIFR